ncbi:MAG: hypothetical protein KIH09_15415, partial [Candidatus Freyarchaeota archaeon]|nr:hypothetical protein [Candidatus Jordarchaeia archaeon]
AGAIGGCYSLNTEYLFPYLIISAYKRQKTYPKNLPNIIGAEAGFRESCEPGDSNIFLEGNNGW